MSIHGSDGSRDPASGQGLVLPSPGDRTVAKAFARLLCRPLTAPVAALAPDGSDYPTVLKRTAIAVVAVWVVFVVATEVVLARS